MSVRAWASDHHFSSRPGKCVKCETWPAEYPALLCDDCGAGAKGRACFVCGHAPAGNPDMVCHAHKGVWLRCDGYAWQPSRNTRSKDSDFVTDS
jgi:hypothetical protein